MRQLIADLEDLDEVNRQLEAMCATIPRAFTMGERKGASRWGWLVAAAGYSAAGSVGAVAPAVAFEASLLPPLRRRPWC